MGKVAEELRAVWPTRAIAITHMSDDAWCRIVGAEQSLGLIHDFDYYWADVLSEAIEAAEALGL